MKKVAKKKVAPLPSTARVLATQVQRTLDKKLDPLLQAISGYEHQMQTNLWLLNSMNTVQERRKTIYKQLSLLLITPVLPNSSGLNEVLFEESLRHLVRDVQAIKYTQNLSESMAQQDYDLIIVLGGEEMLPAESRAVLKQTVIRKAIWLADSGKLTEVERRLVPLFDDVFTQKTSNIHDYMTLQAKRCHFMPFAADTAVYYPRPAEERYQSDVLLIGDALSNPILCEFVRTNALTDKVVRVYGDGWGDCLDGMNGQHQAVIDPDGGQLASYINGANLVLNGSSRMSCVLEVAACGKFQLVQAQADVTSYGPVGLCPNVFHSLDELAERFGYYWTHVDQRRLAASGALADIKYSHSFLQKGIQILDIVFG